MEMAAKVEAEKKQNIDEDAQTVMTMKSAVSNMSGDAKSLAETIMSGKASLIESEITFEDDPTLFMNEEELEEHEMVTYMGDNDQENSELEKYKQDLIAIREQLTSVCPKNARSVDQDKLEFLQSRQ